MHRHYLQNADVSINIDCALRLLSRGDQNRILEYFEDDNAELSRRYPGSNCESLFVDYEVQPLKLGQITEPSKETFIAIMNRPSKTFDDPQIQSSQWIIRNQWVVIA